MGYTAPLQYYIEQMFSVCVCAWEKKINRLANNNSSPTKFQISNCKQTKSEFYKKIGFSHLICTYVDL